jgi:hypothetical protein
VGLQVPNLRVASPSAGLGNRPRSNGHRSGYAHLGRDAEAREAAARLLQVDPAFTISARMGRRRQAHAKLLIEGLRKAGLPE